MKNQNWMAGAVLAGVLALAGTAAAQGVRRAEGQAPMAQQADNQAVRLSEAAPAESGFRFNSPLQITAAREQNLEVAQRRFSDDSLLITSPELAFQSIGPLTNFFIGYKGELQLFRHNSDLRTLDHAARMYLTRRTSPRLEYMLADSFIQTEDPQRNLAGAVFLFPRGQFLENSAIFGVTYRLTPSTTISPTVLNTISKLLLPGVRETQLTTGRIEQAGYAANFAVTHTLTEQQSISAAYSFFVVQDIRNGFHIPFQLGDVGAQTHSANFTYHFGAAPRSVAVELTAGALLHPEVRYQVGAHIEKRWRAFAIGAGYARELALFGALQRSTAASRVESGVLPSNFYQAATLDMSGRLGRRLGFSIGGEVGKSNSGIQITEIKSWSTHGRISYRLLDRVYPYIGADTYIQSFSALLQTSLDRKRYYAGISFVLSRSEEEQPGIFGTSGPWPDTPLPIATESIHPAADTSNRPNTERREAASHADTQQ